MRPMPLPRVIATDLDGTLLGSNREVSERNRRALCAATEAGIRVVVVTARPLRATGMIGDAFACAAVSCGNGAYTVIPEEEPLVRAIDVETASILVKRLRACLPDAAFGVETGTGFYHDTTYRVKPWIPREWLNDPFDDAAALPAAASPVVKLIAQSESAAMHLIHETAVRAVGSLAEVTYSGATGMLELSASGVTKGSTLAMLCQRWGVDADEVVAFGDMPNDSSMLAWAGTGYAMRDGHPDLLDPAQGFLEAPPSTEDGVARVVEKLLREEPRVVQSR